MKTRTFASLILAGSLVPVSGTFAFDPSMQMTGAAFVNACSRAEESWISFCNGYVQAAVDSLRRGDGVCLPAGTSRTAIVTVAHKQIAASPEMQAANGIVAVRTMMQRTYPCR